VPRKVVKYGFYEMGCRAGIDVAETTRKLGSNEEEAFRHSVETYRQADYDDIQVVQFDPAKPEALLRGHKLLESAAANKSGIYRTPRAVDHHDRGMFAGLFSQLLGREVIREFVVLPLAGMGQDVSFRAPNQPDSSPAAMKTVCTHRNALFPRPQYCVRMRDRCHGRPPGAML